MINIIFELSLLLDLNDQETGAVIKSFGQAVAVTLIEQAKETKDNAVVDFQKFGKFELNIRKEETSINIAPAFTASKDMIEFLTESYIDADEIFECKDKKFKETWKKIIFETDLDESSKVNITESIEDLCDEMCNSIISALISIDDIEEEIPNFGVFKVVYSESKPVVVFEPAKEFKELCKDDKFISVLK